MPACLVQILLLRAGIHPNPGPTPGSQHVCPVCQKLVNERFTSVRCSSCHLWCHLRQKNNCSQLKSYREYKSNYICPVCKESNQTTSQPSQPKPTSQTKPSQPTQAQVNIQTKVPAHINTKVPNQPQTDVPDRPLTNVLESQTKPNLDFSQDQPDRKYNLKILQLNCNGIKGKIDEILSWMEENKVKIAALQETKLTEKSKMPNTGDYTLVRKDREINSGGGV